MERILNDAEKIKRAEEIYYRRNNQNFNIENVKKNNKNNIFFNLLIMFNLTIIVFCIQNKNFIFTQDFLGILDEYNVEMTNKFKKIFEGFFVETSVEEDTILDNSNIVEENVKEDNNDVSEKEANIVPNYSESLSSTWDEMDEDIKNLNIAYSFINPLKGNVSSSFGSRESKYQNVTGYHTGIDIAAEKGTPIKASMEGIVEVVSSKGDYGNHVKIRCNNVTTVYAHCTKIFVKQGQIVAQGEKIATVGSTGNSTGPHLHFEIRVDDRYVDPEKIINFN